MYRAPVAIVSFHGRLRVQNWDTECTLHPSAILITLTSYLAFFSSGSRSRKSCSSRFV